MPISTVFSAFRRERRRRRERMYVVQKIAQQPVDLLVVMATLADDTARAMCARDRDNYYVQICR